MRFYFPMLAAAGALCAFGQQYTITTIAGNNTSGFSGDGGSATAAQLNQPGGIVVDSSGNVYFCDGGNHRVRKISNGTITTFAGNGTAGYTGDGKAATSAELNNPVGLALDKAGNLFIADAGNNVIREVSLSSGNITTFAGNQGAGAGYAGDGGVATSAQLNNPTAVTADAFENIYIADSNNNVIRKVAGGNISTIIGGAITAGQLHFPDSVVIDQNQNIFIADTVGRRIVEFTGAGSFNVVAGNESYGFSGDGGLATSAALFDPMGAVVDSSGNLYIADTLNSRIRKVSNGIINTIAGVYYQGYSHLDDGGPATQAALNFPRALAVDSNGNVYISDSANNVIRKLTPVASTPATANAVVNAASYNAQVSPGSLASLFGTNLGGNLVTAGAPLPMSLSGVSVTVNGHPAPILAVNSTQVNFQVPWETSAGTAQVIVSVNGFAGNTVTVPVTAAAPGIFLETGGRAAALNTDNTLNTAANPAKIGSTIQAYLTGSGPVNLAMSDGIAAGFSPLAEVMSQASATIGPLPAQISFNGLAPGFVGLAQMNIVVPPGLASGNYQLTVTIGGVTSNAATVSISGQ
jgi:uncharacterized protein (TIGR03437 family)